ncbi:histidine kinase [Ramlibacter sp. AW1]|uniref:Histidine kinase n=1 Tax=Ramlibacter aurantiacus TaxID=2801330 RepID=A0A936ZNI8_9BURK|nr:histidine kinase [Ramlibacter aurantiacus]MBL0423017.1 histidine kinase [Ramlibacter aurantiacus]
MREPEILSSFATLPGRASPPALGPLVFDACHAGVVLRTVLFGEAVVWVGAMFVSSGFMDWLARAAFLGGGALAAILLWLLVACSLKRVLARLPLVVQQAFGTALGVVAGLYGCAMVWFMGGAGGASPWLASGATGGLMAWAFVAALAWRSKGRLPADTTARLAELQARIRPHFLFNTLNTAAALVREDPARAEAVLEDLADLFRHALAEPGEAVSLSEEVDLARRYLDIEQVRFGDRLRVEWSLDPRAGAARVPPLVLQPLVENAVKHGVEPSAEGARLRISTERRGGAVVVKVANTVPAGQGDAGLGLAQQNVRERLRLMHDVHALFQSGLQDGVYQVRLEVPA